MGNEDRFGPRVARGRKRDVGVGQEARLGYVLPTKKAACSLMYLYWEIVHSLYPFVDNDGICTAYQSLWQSDGPAYDDLSILNIIFALACPLSPTIKLDRRKSSAEVYFCRARHPLNYELWQIWPFQLVQYLLIFDQHLQSSDHPHQCWMVIRLAV